MHWRRAIAARIDDGRDIPMPTATKRGEHAVSVPPSMALKAAVYLAVRDAGISNSELARRLHLDEKEARRILERILEQDARYPTAHRLLASYYEKQGQTAKAAEHNRLAGY